MSSAPGGYGDGDRKAARTLEVQKMIKEAFALFDKDSKGVCDVREVGTIVRHLGICPTEIELRDMITEARRFRLRPCTLHHHGGRDASLCTDPRVLARAPPPRRRSRRRSRPASSASRSLSA